MGLKKGIIVLLILVLVKPAIAQDVTATMNKVKLSFNLTANGTPQYAVFYENKAVIKVSNLGFKLTDVRLMNAMPMDTGFELTGSEKQDHDDTWKPVWGEVSSIRNHYQELTAHLRQKNSGRLLDIVFRVFEDGVGFRYEFPKQAGLVYFIVNDELTQFSLAGDYKSFWIPGDYDSNEYPYTTSKISAIDNQSMFENSTDICVRTVTDRYAVQTPLMMKSDDGLYINIHEAALIDYSAMQLHVDTRTLQLTASLVPDAYGNKAYVHTGSHTPW
jgi:hypothetical protein